MIDNNLIYEVQQDGNLMWFRHLRRTEVSNGWVQTKSVQAGEDLDKCSPGAMALCTASLRS